MSPVGVCIIGAGRAGMVHAINFRDNVPGASLVAIVRTTKEKAERTAADLGIGLFYTDFHQALENPEIDAVCITSPTFTHAEIAIEAAKAGKHIFCEKPMALNLEEVDAMIEAAERAGVKLQLGFMRRFDAAFLSAKKKIQEGLIGKPMIVKSTGRGPGLPPRWACDLEKSNGMLAEVNSHDFDSIRWLMGSEYARIYAEAATLKCHELKEEFPDFYDNAVVVMRFQNDGLGVLDGSCPVDYGYDARMEVLGTEGVIMIGELQYEAVTVCTREDGIVQSTFPSWRNRFREAYIVEACHFIECITKGLTPLATGYDGKKAIEAVLAANRSIKCGTPINLPLD